MLLLNQDSQDGSDTVALSTEEYKELQKLQTYGTVATIYIQAQTAPSPEIWAFLRGTSEVTLEQLSDAFYTNGYGLRISLWTIPT
jgi:hypothetical protein